MVLVGVYPSLAGVGKKSPAGDRDPSRYDVPFLQKFLGGPTQGTGPRGGHRNQGPPPHVWVIKSVVPSGAYIMKL